MEKKQIKEAIENFLKMTEDFNTLGVLWLEKHPDCDIAKLRKEVWQLKTYVELEDVKEIELEGNLLDGTLYRDSVGKYVDRVVMNIKIRHILGYLLVNFQLVCLSKYQMTSFL